MTLLAVLAISLAPADPAALFLRACGQLEAGEIREAATTQTRLAAVAPSAPETLVLGALITRRQANSKGPWFPDFIESLKSAAGADLSKPLLKDEPSTVREIPPARTRVLNPSDLFIFHSSESARPRQQLNDEALALADTPTSFATSLAILEDLMAFQRPAPSAASRLAKRLAAEHPEDVLRRLGAVVAGTDPNTPFGPGEIAALQRAMEGTLSMASFRSLFDSFRQTLAKVDPAQADERAFYVAAGPYPFPEWIVLYRRAKATLASRQPSERGAVGLVMKDVGHLLSSQPILTSWSLARLALEVAADLTGDPDVRREATQAAERFKSTYTASQPLFSLTGEFAIAPLRAEMLDRITRDEVGFCQLVTAAIARH